MFPLHKTLANIPVGPEAPQRGKGIHDYTHILDPIHHEAVPGAYINVRWQPTIGEKPEDKAGWLIASLYDQGGERLGYVESDVFPAEKDGRKFLRIAQSEVRGAPREHNGKRLYFGRKLYEAVMSHARNALGATHVVGGAHSTYAHKAHQYLADKHNLSYEAMPNLLENQSLVEPDAAEMGGFGGKQYSPESWGTEQQEPESIDDRYGPYTYRLGKSEGLETIPVGPQTQSAERNHVRFFDYGHLLTPEQREAGYQLEVRTTHRRYDETPSLMAAWVHQHKPDGTSHKFLSKVEALFNEHDRSIDINFARTDKAHRGQALGQAAYEALIAHGKNNHDAQLLTGGNHSLSADAVHKSIADKYGLSWAQEPRPRSPNPSARHPGSFDDAMSSYALKLHEFARLDGEIGIPLAKEEEEGTDPVMDAIRTLPYGAGWSYISDIMDLPGFGGKHLRALIANPRQPLRHQYAGILNHPKMTPGILDAAFTDEAGREDPMFFPEREGVLSSIARVGPDALPAWANTQWFTNGIDNLSQAIQAHSSFADTAVGSARKDILQRLPSLKMSWFTERPDEIAPSMLEDADFYLKSRERGSLRSGFLKIALSKVTPEVPLSDKAKLNVLAYAKDLVGSLEKFSSEHTASSRYLTRELQGVLGDVKKMIEGGVPAAAFRGNIKKGLYLAMLAHAPGFPAAKFTALLEHVAAGKTTKHPFVRRELSKTLFNHPLITKEHWLGLAKDLRDDLSHDDIVNSRFFDDDLAMQFYLDSPSQEFLQSLADANKLTPSIADFALSNAMGNVDERQKIFAEAHQDALASAFTPRERNQYSYWRLDENGILRNEYDSPHAVHTSNPFAYPFLNLSLFDILKGKVTTQAFHALLDKHAQCVNYALPEHQANAVFGLNHPRFPWGNIDRYNDRTESDPFYWRDALGLKDKSVDDRLTDYLLQRPPQDPDVGAIVEFVRSVDHGNAVKLLGNSKRHSIIDSILNRSDAKPEWIDYVLSRPEFTSASPSGNPEGFRRDSDWGEESLPQFKAGVQNNLARSPALTPAHISHLMSTAKQVASVFPLMEHPNFTSEHASAILDMKPIVFNRNPALDNEGHYQYDDNGYTIYQVASQGNVPWSKGQHDEALRHLLQSYGSKLAPEHWNKMLNDGHFEVSPVTQATAEAVTSKHIPENVLETIWNKHLAAGNDSELETLSFLNNPKANPAWRDDAIDRGPFDSVFYRELLRGSNLPESTVNKMIEKARAVMPEGNWGEDEHWQGARNTAQQKAHAFYNYLAESPHAPEAWVKDLHSKMAQQDQLLQYYGLDPQWLTEHTAVSLGKAIGELMKESSPNAHYRAKSPHVVVRFGSAIWRKVRDLIDTAGGGRAHVNELPKQLNYDRAREMRDMTPEEIAKIPPKNRPTGPVKKKSDFVSTESVQKYIDSLPVKEFNVGSAKYGGAQQHVRRDADSVFQVNLTDEHVKQMKASGVWATFKKLIRGKKDIHPLDNHTLGWVRYRPVDSNGKVFISEIQSDFRPQDKAGLSWHGATANYKHALEQAKITNGRVNPPQMFYFWKASSLETLSNMPSDHLDKINEIAFGKNVDPHEAILEAFHEHLRQQHGPNIKVRITGHDAAAKLRDLDPAEPPGWLPTTYTAIPAKMGYDMDDDRYFSGTDPHAEENDSGGYGGDLVGKQVHTSIVRKFEELPTYEELAKSIATLPPLENPRVQGGERIYDATHYLTPEHRNAGYRMTLHASNGTFGPSTIANVYHRDRIVGGASLFVDDTPVIRNNETRKYAQIDLANINDEHTGKGLGTPMYESLMASATKHWGATHLRGLIHSSLAHGLWNKLAVKHNLNYEATPNYPSAKYPTEAAWESAPNAPIDGKWGGYDVAVNRS
jgi:hypothetical protein